MERLLAAYRVEIKKHFRQRSAYLSFLFTGLAFLANAILFPVTADGVSDYEFVVQATAAVLNWIVPILVLLFGAQLISSEISTGVIRMVLARPIRRDEYILAKLAMAFTYALFVSLWGILLTWGFVFVKGDAAGVIYGGEVLFTNLDMLFDYGIGFVSYLLTLLTFCAYGLLFSVMVRNPGLSSAVALGVWLTLDATKYAFGFDKYLFSTYVGQSWDVFVQQMHGIESEWFPEIIYHVVTCVSSLFLFVSMTLVLFRRKDLHV